jgi:large subunit ribosomal protein L29
LKLSEIRNLSPDERKAKLLEIRQDLMHERGMSAMGGSTRSPGKIRKLRTDIARILTVEREEELKSS